MTKRRITYKSTKRISCHSIKTLFRKAQLWDWLRLSEIEWMLKKALFVASAWDDEKLVGLGTLTGDGRIDLLLDTLIVDENYRRQGIGTAIANMLIAKADTFSPHHFQIQVFDKKVERFYKRLGFRKNTGTWLLDHGPTADKLLSKVKKTRKNTKT